jgi:hypothetical protein
VRLRFNHGVGFGRIVGVIMDCACCCARSFVPSVVACAERNHDLYETSYSCASRQAIEGEKLLSPLPTPTPKYARQFPRAERTVDFAAKTLFFERELASGLVRVVGLCVLQWQLNCCGNICMSS